MGNVKNLIPTFMNSVTCIPVTNVAIHCHAWRTPMKAYVLQVITNLRTKCVLLISDEYGMFI
jgi:hypothetical protein